MKKRIIILGAVVLTVILVWSAGWLFVASQLRQQVDALAFADGETSPQVSCATLNIGGFPFRFDMECVDGTVLSGDLLVELPALRASAMVYRPNHIRISAQGPAQLSDAFTGLRQSLAWSGAEMSLRVEDWRIARISLVVDGLAWTDRLFGETRIAAASHLEAHLLDMPELHDPDAGRAALAAYIRVDDLDAPVVSPSLIAAELEAEATGLPDDLRNWGAVPFLFDWHRAGGQLRLVGLRASDGIAEIDASGAIGLDADGYPAGAIDISTLGVAERLQPYLENPMRTLMLGVQGPDGRHTNRISFAGGGIAAGLVPIAGVPPLF